MKTCCAVRLVQSFFDFSFVFVNNVVPWLAHHDKYVFGVDGRAEDLILFYISGDEFGAKERENPNPNLLILHTSLAFHRHGFSSDIHM